MFLFLKRISSVDSAFTRVNSPYFKIICDLLQLYTFAHSLLKTTAPSCGSVLYLQNIQAKHWLFWNSFFYWKFHLKRKKKEQKNKEKDTSETTGIPTASTDTLKITNWKTWEACDQANKKIASSKLFLFHLLLHTCTKRSHKYYFCSWVLYSLSPSPLSAIYFQLEVCICLILVEPHYCPPLPSPQCPFTSCVSISFLSLVESQGG